MTQTAIPEPMDIYEADTDDIGQLVVHHRMMFAEIWERKGLKPDEDKAREIEKALQYCRENGIKRVVLNASEDGRPLYEKSGFTSVLDAIRLLLNESCEIEQPADQFSSPAEERQGEAGSLCDQPMTPCSEGNIPGP